MIFLILFCAGQAFSQDRFGVRASYLLFDDGWEDGIEYDLDSSIMLEVNLTKAFSENMQIEFNLGFTETDLALTIDGRDDVDALDLKQIPIVIMLQYMFNDYSEKFTPYLEAGIGLYLNDITGNSAGWIEGSDIEAENDFGVLVGIGAEFPISEKASLNIDLKYLYNKLEMAFYLPDEEKYKDDDFDISTPIVGIGYKRYF